MPARILTAPEELTIHHVRGCAPEFLAAACSGEQVGVDLSMVIRIDTAGLQLLLMVRREAARAGTALEFVAPAAVICDVMSFCQLGDVLSPSH